MDGYGKDNIAPAGPPLLAICYGVVMFTLIGRG